MRSRWFVLLAGVLVTLNLVLWLASPGLAIRKAIIQQLFGPKLIRADVVTKSGEWLLDRGVITQISGSQLTLREADTRVQVIPLASSTRFLLPSGRAIPGARLGRGWRVLVFRPLNGAAVSVDIEHAPKGHLGVARSAAPALHLS